MAKQSKVRSVYKRGHRAHKRDSRPAEPVGVGRDARHAERRVKRRKRSYQRPYHHHCGALVKCDECAAAEQAAQA